MLMAIAGPSMHDEAGAFLAKIVSLYNAGVRTRDFSGFLDLLTDDAIFDFEGTSERGPLEGKRAIAQHFADDPPDDAIRVKRWKQRDEAIVAEFSWSDIPEGGGCLFITPREDRVARITIVLGGPRRLFR
jgi:SnoaL-like protein